jgi:ATP-binding cassette subfamily F protein 3
MISINQLTVSFGGFNLFEDISFLINPRDRIGLVGKNGAGKSTLLKIISRQMQPTSGDVAIWRDITIGYLPQNMLYSDTQTVKLEVEEAFREIKQLEAEIEMLTQRINEQTNYESPEYLKLIDDLAEKNDAYQMFGGYNYEAQIELTLKGLGFKRTDFNRLTSEFSGGWRMRIELAKILLRKPSVFLLDEPTNHLDIESIQWLEDYLRNYSGAIVLISHDKAFLDNITERTIEISLGMIYDYKVSYSKFVTLRKERREQQEAAYRNQQKMIQDTEDFIERFRYKATKAVQVQSRIKQLEKVERIEIDEFDESSLRIKFPPAPHSGIVTVKGVGISKNYGALQVLHDVSFSIQRGEKVAFVGKNGEGKTTLARIIMNEIEYTGKLELGHQVKIGYFAQNQADKLDENLTVLETIDRVAVGAIRTKIRDILGAFLFGGEAVDKKVSVLSGGERTRLAMVLLLLEPVNFLILDEPTNHLDMRSKEILKKALADFEGTILLVSHDREFLDGLVQRVVEFGNRKIKEHIGGIYEFLEKKRIDNLCELESVNRQSSGKQESKKTADNSKASFEERKELSRRIKKISNKIEALEKDIEKLEAELAQMADAMQCPNAATVYNYEDYEKISKTLSQKMSEWELCHTELEEVEKM